MKFRFHVISLMILAYSLLLVHEVVYGRHLSNEPENYHHHCNHAHGFDHSGNEIPCFMDVNPHLVTASSDYLSDMTDNPAPSFQWFGVLVSLYPELPPLCLSCIRPQKEPGITAFSDIRSHQLRGPPVA